MRQTPLLRWIEVAESARFCRLADEAARAKVTTRTSKPPPLDLSSLRQQLCLGDMARRLSRFTRPRSAD
jgi:hypothetical protein